MKIGLNNIFSLESSNAMAISNYYPHLFAAALQEDERQKREAPNLIYTDASYCNHKRFYVLSEDERSFLVPKQLCFDNKRFLTRMDNRSIFHFKIDGKIFSAHYHRLTEDNVIEWKHDPPAEKKYGKVVIRQENGEDLLSAFYFTEFDDCCFHQEYLIKDHLFHNKTLDFIKEKYGMNKIEVFCHEHRFNDTFSLTIQFNSFEFSYNMNAKEILNLEHSYDFLIDRLVDSCEFMLQNRDMLKL